jgi:hypothetical protein
VFCLEEEESEDAEFAENLRLNKETTQYWFTIIQKCMVEQPYLIQQQTIKVKSMIIRINEKPAKGLSSTL